METKVCGRCGQAKPLDQFSVDNRTGKATWCCKPCNSERTKEYDFSPQERERRAAKTRAFRQRHIKAGLCVSCNRKAVKGTYRCRIHLADARERAKLARADYKVRGLCQMCGQRRPRPGLKHCAPCLAAALVRSFRTLAKLKTEVFDHYGWACECCGEKDPDCITIDHIAGDGAKHRREIGPRALYSWLRQHGFPTGFRTLCYSCNVARSKGHNFGICPHKADEAQNETLLNYGGQCACCGITEAGFLVVAAVDREGFAAWDGFDPIERHRRMSFWLKSKGFPAGFKVLCANCDEGERQNHGVCPHQAAKEQPAVLQ